MKATGFEHTPRDFCRYIEVLSTLNIPRRAKVLDFGCSWGYGSWQIAQKGYSVSGFEISVKRAEYAKQMLGIPVETNIDQLNGNYDVFFSRHCLEHVPVVSSVLRRAMKLLKPGGIFYAIVPNGSLQYKHVHLKEWNTAWGLKHSNHLDEIFFENVFSDNPLYISTFPLAHSDIEKWADSTKRKCSSLTGKELIVLARKQQ
jgi:cyclopropane fatty-acyl-phospholipid synthase-like methyltransferase